MGVAWERRAPSLGTTPVLEGSGLGGGGKRGGRGLGLAGGRSRGGERPGRAGASGAHAPAGVRERSAAAFPPRGGGEGTGEGAETAAVVAPPFPASSRRTARASRSWAETDMSRGGMRRPRPTHR